MFRVNVHMNNSGWGAFVRSDEPLGERTFFPDRGVQGVNVLLNVFRTLGCPRGRKLLAGHPPLVFSSLLEIEIVLTQAAEHLRVQAVGLHHQIAVRL